MDMETGELIDFNQVVKTNIFKNELTEHQDSFVKMFDEACSELLFYDWCLEITQSYVGLFYPGIVGVFLMNIETSSDDIDNWLWVIVGDLPKIYITCDEAPNAACALDGYIGAMSEWVDAARTGSSIEGIVPVNLPANPENAGKLETRLKFLDREILANHSSDL